MSNTVDAKTLNEALQQHIRPDTFPVAVRLVPPGEVLPAKTRRPHQDLEIQVTICQGVAMSRRYGWTMAVGEEDLSCPLAAAVFGFKPMLDYMAQFPPHYEKMHELWASEEERG